MDVKSEERLLRLAMARGLLSPGALECNATLARRLEPQLAEPQRIGSR